MVFDQLAHPSIKFRVTLSLSKGHGLRPASRMSRANASESRGSNLNMQQEVFIYILKCLDESYYVGSSTNIEQRIKDHNSGKASNWTRSRRPLKLVYFEKHTSLLSARRRELQIKKWSRVKKEKLINGKLVKSISTNAHT